MKRYEKYKDSGVGWIGEIPEHWECKRLGTWFTERREKVSDKDFEPLSVTKNGIVSQLETAAKSNDGDNRKGVYSGDFVINSRSDRKGSSGLAKKKGSVSLINIVMKLRNINADFSEFLLKSNSFIEEFYRNGHGIVADLWTTRFEDMKFINIPIPSIAEQQAIASFLDDKTAKIDQTISIKEKEIELLKERRQILIQKAVTKGLDDKVKLKDSGVEWIGEIPEHWNCIRIKQCSKKISKGTTPSTEGREILLEGEIRFIKSENIIDGIVADKPLFFIDKKTNFIMKRSSLQTNDVLFVIAGASLGKVAIVQNSIVPANTNQAVSFIRPNSKVHPLYLSKFLLSNTIRELTWLDAVQSAQPNLSMENLGNFPISLPSLEEQTQIVSYLEKIEEKISKAISLKQQEIEKLKEYKTVLIDNVVTGKVKIY